MPGRLGELLVRENLITLQQLQKAQEQQRQGGGRLGFNLTKLGYIEESELTSFLSKQYGVPSINLAEFEIDPDVIKLVPQEVAEKHQVIPVNRAGASLIVAMADPSNIFAIDDLKFLTGYNIEVVVASDGAIREAIGKYYGSEKADSELNYDEVMAEFDEDEIEVGGDDDAFNVVDLERSAEDAPVVKLVNLILIDAIKKGASDIHIEPYEKDFRVRYRIDGVLYEKMKPPLKLKGGHHLPNQDHEPARYRRAPACRRTAASSSSSARAARWTTACRVCPRCSAKRSCCACSTRAACSST